MEGRLFANTQTTATSDGVSRKQVCGAPGTVEHRLKNTRAKPKQVKFKATDHL